MPITGIGTWLPTIDEVLAHWLAVNNELSLSFSLLGAYTRSSLESDRADLATALANVQSAANTLTSAAANRDSKKAAMKIRLTQFNAAVRGSLPGSDYVKSLPPLPSSSFAPGKWNDRMDDVSNLWTTINANSPAVTGFTPPLKLNGPYTLANFNTDVTALKTAFTNSSAAEQNFEIALSTRNRKFDAIYARLKQYREAVVGALSSGSALLATIPRLTPLPGSTPAAVVLNASWNAGISKAALSWTASAAADLDHYEVRYCTGSRYRTADELTVPGLGTISAATTAVNTDFGLLSSGSSIIFKVYVVTHTSNEKGSNSVKVIRP